MKPTAPMSVSHIICLSDLLLFAFIFRSIKLKYKNTLLEFILIYFVWRSIYQSTTISSRPFAHLGAPLPERD